MMADVVGVDWLMGLVYVDVCGRIIKIQSSIRWRCLQY
jgi:hypothetical protein